MTHPHPKRNFVPRAVLMKSSLKTLNTAGQNSSRASVSVNTARPINTAYPRPTVNNARTSSNVFNKEHSHGNPQLEFQEKEVIDSGCSRHMTRNKSYLSYYEEIDGRFVTFGGNPKGGKITGKVPRKNNMYSVDLKNVAPSGEMNQFCEKQCIEREFSVARTLQQNGAAKRKNRTLIKAARTMLADSKLPTAFWAEAVNIACYVQNRVLVIKPHNKTLYEHFHGRTPSLSFMRPFGCPVIIFNTLDHLGKFDGNADEEFFVGYFVNSKASRVFNSRTRIVEETLHITFLENKPNVAGSGPEWLFNIDTLTKSINYKPIVAGNQSNGNAGTKACDDAGEEENKDAEDSENKDSEVPSTEDPRVNQKKDANINNTNNINTISPTINVVSIKDNAIDENIVYRCADDPNIPNLEEIVYSYDDEDVGAEADMTNLDTHIRVSPIPTTRIHKDHPVK
ncbi:ribonuclease H-like domain-containing protein [Tanacetum coccineum]|uniref:Ribonuclease H-like domain-containing protein n=1 Tax=Tanacetum coccineum TaxID=301880 RepID=A0ABQ4ZHR7_9ASTR